MLDIMISFIRVNFNLLYGMHKNAVGQMKNDGFVRRAQRHNENKVNVLKNPAYQNIDPSRKPG